MRPPNGLLLYSREILHMGPHRISLWYFYCTPILFLAESLATTILGWSNVISYHSDRFRLCAIQSSGASSAPFHLRPPHVRDLTPSPCNSLMRVE